MKRTQFHWLTPLLGAALLPAFQSAQALTAPDSKSVLILGSSVSGGVGSIEAARATALGLTPVVVDDATWSAMSASEFGTFRALILGDPNCSLTVPSAALANRAVWGPTINGNVVTVGTDPMFHNSSGGQQVTESVIKFAAAEPLATGAYIGLSCYYNGTTEGTPVPLLDTFGAFTVKGVGCFNAAHLVALHPALSGSTDATLSNWSCSVHEAFDSFPPTFLPLAIARGAAGSGVLSFADGSSGIPYILARGKDLVPVACGDGKLDPGEECDDGNTANGDGCSAQCKKEIPVNKPPICDKAAATAITLWPPNHQMRQLSISGISDPNGDSLTIAITDIKQDEPLTGNGSGNFSPDAIINSDGSFNLRVERQGINPHNGRVYTIGVEATDPFGEKCTTNVSVCVPHDQGNRNFCRDDGASYDSTK